MGSAIEALRKLNQPPIGQNSARDALARLETQPTLQFEDLLSSEQGKYRTIYKYGGAEAVGMAGFGDVDTPRDIQIKQKRRATIQKGLGAIGRHYAQQTEDISGDIDRLLGVWPDPYRGDRPPTPEEEKFQRLGEVPVVGPAVQAGSHLLRMGTRGATGIAGFVAGLPGYVDKQPSELAEEARGIREEMFGSVLPSIDYYTQRAFGVADPSASVDPGSPFSRLQQAITGKPFTREAYQQAVSTGVSQAPETPGFGVALGRGGLGVLRRVAKKVPSRAPVAARGPLEAVPETKPVVPKPELVTRGKVEVPKVEKPVGDFSVGDRVQTRYDQAATIVDIHKDGVRAVIKTDLDGRTGVIEVSELSPLAKKVLKPPTRPVAERPAKQPWEMTREEFAVSDRLPARPKKQSLQKKAMYDVAAFRIHRSNVQRALAEGKPVPAEVLKDYPDLAKKAKPPTEALDVTKGDIKSFEQFMEERGIPDPGADHGMLKATAGVSGRARRAYQKRRDAEFVKYGRAQKEYRRLVERGEIIEPEISRGPKAQAAHERVQAKRQARREAAKPPVVEAPKVGEPVEVDLTRSPDLVRKTLEPLSRPVRAQKVKSAGIEVSEAETNFATPKQQTMLYPLVAESTVKKGRFQPATDAQLTSFTQTTPEQFATLSTAEKSAVRKQYSHERRKQRNAEKLDELNRKDFGIEPDPVLRKRLAEPPPDAPPIENVRDINKVEKGLKDPDRNFEKALPKDVAETLIAKRDAAKVEYSEFLIKEEARQVTEVIKGLSIKPGSKMAQAVQKFGEGDWTLEQITKKFGPARTKNIVDAAAWYRAAYERHLKTHNTTASSLHPGDRSKLIPRREKYFRHFRELGDLSRLLDIVEDPGGTLSAPSRILQFMRPGVKKLSIIRRRLGRRTLEDATAGYANYLQEVGYGIHINPVVNYMRQFGRKLDKAYMEKNQAPNFRDWFHTWVNKMSGVQDGADAYFSNNLGAGWDVMHLTNRRAKQNIILGNVGALLAQPFNIPQAIARAGPVSFSRGAAKTLAQIFMRSDIRGRRSIPMTKSPFIRERYIESSFDKYRFGWVNRPRMTASWIMRVADEIPTKMIWNAFYEKALSQNKSNPIIYADRMTRQMVAGRGIGELPNVQRAKWFQMVAPFQVEVGNAMWAFLDLTKGQRKFSKVATFMVASWIMNRMAENIRGTPVSFDPLQAMIEGIQIAADERRGTFERVVAIPGRLAGEALSNVPLGQTAAALYPQYGATIPGTDIKLPTRKQVFGSNDPTRFGSTVLFWDALKDPLSRVLLPFGGVQVKKTLTGAKALVTGEVKFGQKALPIEQTGENTLRALLFGPYATKEARAFFRERDQRITKNTMVAYLHRLRATGKFQDANRAFRLWNKENPTRTISETLYLTREAR